MQDLMDTGALTKSSDNFGKFLSHFLDQEQKYIEFLRDGRQRAFFVTSHSVVGTVRKPYVPNDQLTDQSRFGGGLFLRNRRKKPRRGNRPGRDGRTSRQRLKDMQKRPKFAQRFGAGAPTATKFARNFGRANALVNVATAGIEFSDRVNSGQSVAKAGVGTAASVAGGLAGAAKGATIGAAIGSVIPGAGTLVGGIVGGLIGGFLGSTVAGATADVATGLVGLNKGGVMKAPTRSVIAEAGEPETLIPFDVIGRLVKSMVFDPLGSLMVGATESLLAVLPTNSSMSKLKITIGRLKKQFGSENVGAAIKGAPGSIADGLGNGLEVTMSLGMSFILSLVMAGPAQASPPTTYTSSVAGDVSDRGNGQFGEGPLLKAAKEEGIEGKELAAFLAQMSHETGNFQFRRELSGGHSYYGGHTGPWTDANGKTYTTKYHGRGYIQLTHDYNYKKYGDMFGVDLLNNPDLAMDGDLAAKIAVAYWKQSVRPRVQRDGGDWDNVFSHSAAVNYPAASSPADINGYDDRVAKYNGYKQQLTSGELEKKQEEALKGPEPKPEAKISPDKVKELGKTLDKIEENSIDNLGLKLQIPGVGTILQGKGWFGNAQVKYFTENGEEINQDKWYRLLEARLPEKDKESLKPQGGSFEVGMVSPKPVTQPKVNKDPESLNVPAIKRDSIATNAIEEKSFTLMPMMTPGPNVPYESIVEKVVARKEPSYIDPFSHGVKRGKRVVL